MGYSPNRSSSAHRAATTDPLRQRPTLGPLLLLLLAAGCSRAEPPAHPDPVPSASPVAPAAEAGPGETLCIPSERGFLKARLQGSIDADLDWSTGGSQCRGGVRPGGDGIRLLYKGPDGAQGQLLVVLGAGPLRAGEHARNVPVNLTIVREGTGRFYATQGDDKCVFDEVRQEPLADHAGQYLLTGRGFCTQPARAVGGDGSVLLSRFDVEAIVDYTP